MPVLDADDLVVGREDVFPPKAELVMLVPVVVVMRIVFGVRMGSEVSGSVHMRKTETEYQGKVFKRKARICRIWASRSLVASNDERAKRFACLFLGRG